MSARRNTLLSVFALTAALGACTDNPVESPITAQEGRWRDSPPGQVTDLAVKATTASSVVLTFTEVEDGGGKPANYQIRYAPSPIGHGWGSATVVDAGTCASPLPGREVGAMRECSVEGLEAGSAHDFQIVAFRGGLNKNATFGALSNVATGTTAAVDTEAMEPADTTSTVPQDTTTTVTVPGTVTNLGVKSAAATSVVLSFTQVTDGAGGAADYQVRYAPNPIGWGWGSATPVSAGSCANLEGTVVGQTMECSVEGLTTGQKYDFQMVAYRGTIGVDATYGGLSNIATGTTTDTSSGDGSTGGQGGGSECDNPSSAWIFCDDFEKDRMSSYFEYDAAGGAFARMTSVGVGGSSGMRARFAAGQVSAGSLKLAFGRTPQSYFRPVDTGTQNYRDIYWRVWVRNEPDWTGGGGNKLSRATIFSSSSTWAQAMIGHVWTATTGPGWNYLAQDPASGTDSQGNVVTTKYNDFANLRWLGATQGSTPLFTGSSIGQWQCVEARVRLNDAGSANGVFEVWVNGQLDSRKTNLDWIGKYSDYGINAVMLENYWNGGSPKSQERYMDNFVVSTRRIGC